MISKIILSLLLILTAFGQNCLPGQYVDLQKGTCSQCADLQNTVEGGRDGFCECQPGFWYSVKEAACLSENEINSLYAEKSESEREEELREAHIRGRNLGVIVEFSSTRPPTIVPPKPVVKNTTQTTTPVKPVVISNAERPKPTIISTLPQKTQAKPVQNLRTTN